MLSVQYAAAHLGWSSSVGAHELLRKMCTVIINEISDSICSSECLDHAQLSNNQQMHTYITDTVVTNNCLGTTPSSAMCVPCDEDLAVCSNSTNKTILLAAMLQRDQQNASTMPVQSCDLHSLSRQRIVVVKGHIDCTGYFAVAYCHCRLPWWEHTLCTSSEKCAICDSQFVVFGLYAGPNFVRTCSPGDC